MPRYALFLAYEGTAFHGWQKQEVDATSVLARRADPTLIAAKPGCVALRTVQAVVEKAVRQAVRDQVTLVGASRTDSGVHARGQVASFSSEHDGRGRGWPIERGLAPLVRAINAQLPEDVLVQAARVVPDEFHPIGGATRKEYSFVFHDSRDRPLWDRHRVTQVWHPLDTTLMHQAAQYLIGEHDFVSMCAADHGRQSTVRTVYRCDVKRIAPDRIKMQIEGNGFLYNMVRIIAGTLAEVGRHRYPPEHVRSIIEARDRTKAGVTLDPSGLTLEWIEYTHPERGLFLRSDETCNTSLPIEMPRLTLRAPVESDADALAPMWQDPAVTKYIGDGSVRPIERVRESTFKRIAQLKQTGATLFTVERKDESGNPEIIGDCGVCPVNWEGPEIELGYRFKQSAWGNGYATEAARAALDYAFTTTSLDRILGLTHPENTASMQVLTKVGMTSHGLTERFYGTTLRWFSITHRQWTDMRTKEVSA
ncbi:MAG: tRNA pseudouridine(38-40) synthase TruA [Phycisphaeraceae bacterium]|nr:tRNA pseudouridine(38-40) synthase TruA [Phycisphaerales bacterium]MCB9859047.1 tRNA pseudouridine(38-40) synthase TruA [Phycisphaeraceae bacterium]